MQALFTTPRATHQPNVKIVIPQGTLCVFPIFFRYIYDGVITISLKDHSYEELVSCWVLADFLQLTEITASLEKVGGGGPYPLSVCGSTSISFIRSSLINCRVLPTGTIHPVLYLLHSPSRHG